MNAVSQPLPRPARGRWPAMLVLVLSLAATAFAWWREHELARRDRVIQMQDGLSRANQLLMPMLGSRFEMLHDAANAVLRRERVTLEAWTGFLESAEWRQRFPGMKEVGYAERATTDDGREVFTIRFFNSPLAQPLHQPGSDLAGNPVIADAIQKSLAVGHGVPSAEVKIDAAQPVPTRGIIGLFPMQLRRTLPGTPEENRANVRGFVFFALNQAEYFAAGQSQLTNLSITLAYLPPEAPAPPRTVTQRVFTIGTTSGTWRLLATLKAEAPRTMFTQWVVLTLGLGLSALLFFLFTTQSRLRQASEAANLALQRRDAEIHALNEDLERRISQRTAELTDTNEKLKGEIREREYAEAHLARFKALAEATSDLVAMTGMDGKVIYANKVGRTMIGLPEATKLEGRHYREFYPAWVHRLFDDIAIPAAMQDGYWKGDVALLHADGREIPASMVGLIIRGPDGQPAYMAAIHRDISERRQFEESLQAALAEEKELSQLKSNFISMVSHEIRTPLALILSSSEILSRYHDRLPAEKRARHLEQIDESVQRMSALMEDVLLFSRAEAGRIEFNPSPLDLAGFLRQLVDETLSTTGRRCPIELDLAGSLADARGDEALLRHILGNLLSNAVKYSEAGAPVKLRARREAGEVVFEVADRGIGIPETDHAKLFRPFHRGANVKHVAGTGLGLVIVRRCVERHGGCLDIQSRENAGTTATVRLPVFTPAHTEFMKKFN